MDQKRATNGPKKGYKKGSKLTLSKYCVHKWARIEGGAQLILATPAFSLQSIQPLKGPIHVVFYIGMTLKICQFLVKGLNSSKSQVQLMRKSLLTWAR